MGDVFPVIVNCSKSLDEMIKAGNYDWVNWDISEKHFPVQGQGQTELNIELIHYGKHMESDDVVRDLEGYGLRPATLSELLAFGAAYPNKQREFPIVALGSVWRSWSGSGLRCVLCLRGGGSGRELGLYVWGSGWRGGCRFAAVRK